MALGSLQVAVSTLANKPWDGDADNAARFEDVDMFCTAEPPNGWLASHGICWQVSILTIVQEDHQLQRVAANKENMPDSLVAIVALVFLLVPRLIVSALKIPELEQVVEQHGKAGDGVDITILQEAKKKGAVCLDGSAPAYHLRRGFGSGASNWHIHLQGGGWCESQIACAKRARTSLGSSSYMSNQILFNGLLSNKRSVNPDFYNWNHVYVRYCDGASFSGDAAAPVKLASGQVLYFRGRRIFRALVEHIQGIELNKAKQALLSGCSAGGLAVIHRCNDFQGLLPGVKVKCLSDAGFFLNAPSIKGKYPMYSLFKGVVNVQKLQNTLSSACTSAVKDATKCFFPQDAQAYVQPPLFFVNAAYDFWQLENVKQLSRSQYSPCIKSSSCSQVQTLQAFRKSMLNGLSYAKSRSSWGTFVDSCFSHCQVENDETWSLPKVDGKSTAQAVGDWYFNRAPSHHIDCPYPACNPTCVS